VTTLSHTNCYQDSPHPLSSSYKPNQNIEEMTTLDRHRLKKTVYREIAKKQAA
jgi:hypothetical protein